MKRLITMGVIGAFALVACGGSDGGTASDVANSTDDSALATDGSVSSIDAGQTEQTDDAAATAPVSGTEVLFTAPTGDYTVVFPGEPVRNDLPVPLPGETVVADAYLYEIATGAFFTSAFDYPEGLTDSDPTVVLEGARDGAVKNVGATLDTSEFIERNGIPGISFTFSIDDALQSGVGSAVVFFDPPRLYQSFALGESAGKADYQAFVDTFVFIDASSTENDS